VKPLRAMSARRPARLKPQLQPVSSGAIESASWFAQCLVLPSSLRPSPHSSRPALRARPPAAAVLGRQHPQSHAPLTAGRSMRRESGSAARSKNMRVLYVGLSVRDARRSARWYRDLFGMETVRENFTSSNWESDWDEVLLKHPVSGLLIGLLQHPANPGEPFSEFRTGLDHPEFEVAGRDELERWEERLTALGIPHSGSRIT
jgi:glyoxylase I family protein